MVRILGPVELKNDVIDNDNCIACGACVNLCPYFKTYRGKTAMVFPCTLPQGRCHAFCPKTEVDLDALANKFRGQSYDASPLGPFRSVMITRAGDKFNHNGFQSGGTVSALTAFALKTGLIKAAVLTKHKNLIPKTCLVDRAEDVKKYSFSKYMASPGLAILNQAISRGGHHLGLVGTPCQILAASLMQADFLGKGVPQDLIGLKIGLFCTFALDTRKLIGLLKTYLADLSLIRKMDIPPPPAQVMIIETASITIEIPLAKIRPLIPQGCGLCIDMTSEWADLSVGVVEDRPDFNTLIIRTDKGEQVVKNALREGWLEQKPLPDKNLAHLMEAASNKKKRALHLADEKGLLNTKGSEKISALRLGADIIAKIMAWDKETIC